MGNKNMTLVCVINGILWVSESLVITIIIVRINMEMLIDILTFVINIVLEKKV